MLELLLLGQAGMAQLCTWIVLNEIPADSCHTFVVTSVYSKEPVGRELQCRK